MEPPKVPVRYAFVFQARVASVEQKIERVWTGGVGDNAKFTESSRGWWMHLQGSWEAIFVGWEPPDIKRDDNVQVTIERIP